MILVSEAKGIGFPRLGVRQQLGNSSKKLGGKGGGLERMGQALTHTLALHRVPDIAVEVIVACEEQATTE